MRIIIEIDDDTEPTIQTSPETSAESTDWGAETSATDAGSPMFSGPEADEQAKPSSTARATSAIDAGASPDGEGMPEPLTGFVPDPDSPGPERGVFGGGPEVGNPVPDEAFVESTNAGGPADDVPSNLEEREATSLGPSTDGT